MTLSARLNGARRRWRRSAPARQLIGLEVVIRHRLAAGRPPLRMLVLSDGAEYTSEQQFAPLLRFSRQLARHCGLVATHGDTANAARLGAADLQGFHIVAVKFGFRTPRNIVVGLVRHLANIKPATCRLVYFDGDDDLCVQWPEVLELADGYVKKHLFSDPRALGQGFVGKTNLTDHVHRQFGTSFAENEIAHTPPLPAALRDKPVLGWNIALDDKIAELARSPLIAAQGTRDIDISCRASVSPTVWTHPMRSRAVAAIEALAPRWRVSAPTDRVPQAIYYRELCRSRISVSPFGFGELCWRDFETILCGAVLVKPDMSHLRTAPDLFVPGETYLPVRWDYADLAEVCAPCLADEAARRRVAETARTRLLDALGADWFVNRFEQTLGALGIKRDTH